MFLTYARSPVSDALSIEAGLYFIIEFAYCLWLSWLTKEIQ
jgi:hypothetical protein